MNKTIILLQDNHPLSTPLRHFYHNLNFDKYVEEQETHHNLQIVMVNEFGQMSSLDQEKIGLHCEYVFEMTLMTGKEKLKFLDDFIENFAPKNIFCEGSFSWGELILQTFSSVKGIFALGFPLPQILPNADVNNHKGHQNFEMFLKTENFKNNEQFEKVKDYLNQFFNPLLLKPLMINFAPPGMIFPRVLSTLINEAYFALEENLSSKQDINLAMVNGVNHPMGPIEWCEQVGAERVCLLLDFLYETTKNPRYRVSETLRLLSYDV